ncbi:MAG: prenyltransferase/squalene oxidase repeat-containing protein [Phycisphaerae bacterium]
MRITIAIALLLSVSVAFGDPPPVADLIRTATAELLKMQEPDGAWPYEGVYRVGGEIPLGYRVGGTAIAIEALLYGSPDATELPQATDRGLAYILSKLDDKLLAPSTAEAYDVRVWGHCCVLQAFCRLREKRAAGKHADEVNRWIPKLVEALLIEQLPDGGWNYATRQSHAPFVSASVLQTLLLARSQGETVPDDVLERGRDVLAQSRYPDGAFTYMGRVGLPRRRASSQPTSTPATTTTTATSGGLSSAPAASGPSSMPVARTDQLPGSIARSAICESTLQLLGDGSERRIAAALDAFHAHWQELENRRRKTGTHLGPYGIAPYYFYFGHRYAGQAIQLLPPERRERERARLLEVVLRTRDEDGTWNDRVFPRSRNYGTAMIVLALLGDHSPLPPAWKRG